MYRHGGFMICATTNVISEGHRSMGWTAMCTTLSLRVGILSRNFQWSTVKMLIRWEPSPIGSGVMLWSGACNLLLKEPISHY